LLMFFFSSMCRRKRCQTRKRVGDTGDGPQYSNDDEAMQGVDEVVRDLRHAMDRCGEVSEGCGSEAISSAPHVSSVPGSPEITEETDGPQLVPFTTSESKVQARQDALGPENTSAVTLALPKVSKRRGPDELKIWMEKQRGQCEVVENTQALIVTDAKHDGGVSAAATRPEHVEAGRAEEAPPLDAAPPRSQRAKLRSYSETRELMDRKRDQCHVLESAQEHIDTDAKAPGSQILNAKRNSLSPPNKENLVKCHLSNQEVQVWMSLKRDQCEVLGQGVGEVRYG